MAVLCEAISVIVRRDSIDRYYEGGWSAFVHDLPHQKMCTDEELVSVGFWDPASVETYIRGLESKGLQFDPKKHMFAVFDQSRAINDIAVIDQRDGLTRPCEWIEQMRSEVGDTGIKVLMFIGTRSRVSFYTSPAKMIRRLGISVRLTRLFVALLGIGGLALSTQRGMLPAQDAQGHGCCGSWQLPAIFRCLAW
jgi:hypothetical protein